VLQKEACFWLICLVRGEEGCFCYFMKIALAVFVGFVLLGFFWCEGGVYESVLAWA